RAMNARSGPISLSTVALWAAWLAALAVWTAALLTPQPVQAAQAVLPPEMEFPTAKTLHVGAYAFLTVLACRLPRGGPCRWLPLAVLSLHGLGTEYLQQFVESRCGCWQDVGLDHVGIALGLLVGWIGWRKTESADGAP